MNHAWHSSAFLEINYHYDQSPSLAPINYQSSSYKIQCLFIPMDFWNSLFLTGFSVTISFLFSIWWISRYLFLFLWTYRTFSLLYLMDFQIFTFILMDFHNFFLFSIRWIFRYLFLFWWISKTFPLLYPMNFQIFIFILIDFQNLFSSLYDRFPNIYFCSDGFP